MRTRILAVAGVLGFFGGLLGCNALLGVSFGDAVLEDSKPVATDVDGGGGGGGGGDTDAGRIDRCIGKKVCDVSGDCVTPTPENGCGDPSCKPCSAPFATAFYCDKDGKCQVDGNASNAGCAAGRGDCDKDLKNGCEASFNNPQTCGGCKTTCNAASTPLCSPVSQGDGGAGDGGALASDSYQCGATCASGATQCGNSCVDVSRSVDHCGACGKACGVVANGSPACRSGACGATCSTGYSDCANPTAPKTCAPTPKWYRDGDGDGYGSGLATTACAAPAGYVARTGDCDDTNAAVYPGQTRTFGTPYTVAGTTSFDYNCDGAESGSYSAYPGSCGALCDRSGYLPTGRTGVGVNAYCGSTNLRTCSSSGVILASEQVRIKQLPTAQPGTCSTFDQLVGAVGCN